MRSSQRGVTFIGWVFLLTPVAVLIYVAIRLTPVYLNYMRVARSLTQVATEYQDGSPINPAVVRNSIEKRFDIESIENPAVKDIDIHRDGENWVVVADYENVEPLFANVSLLVNFHKEVQLR